MTRREVVRELRGFRPNGGMRPQRIRAAFVGVKVALDEQATHEPGDGRKCTRCNTWKSAEYFTPDPRNSTGLKSHCRTCSTVYMAQWRKRRRG